MKKLKLKILDWETETEAEITSADQIWNIGGPSATIIFPSGKRMWKSDNNMEDITYLIFDEVSTLLKN